MNNQDIADTTPAPQKSIDTTLHNETITDGNGDYQTMYITIADTGADYYKLRAAMAMLNNASHLPIDTLNRYYSTVKKKIVVADNDEDEMYRGEYFPRRYPSVNLSLEYMSTYIRTATDNNIGLIAGICETQQAADSVLKIIKPAAPKAFVLKGEVFLGCMH